VQFLLQFEPPPAAPGEAKTGPVAVEKVEAPAEAAAEGEGEAKIVSLDQFRKK
jgi:hypothetical protein